MTSQIPQRTTQHTFEAYRERLDQLAKAKSLTLDKDGNLLASNTVRNAVDASKPLNRLIELKVMEFLVQGRGCLSTLADLNRIRAVAKLVGLVPQQAASTRAHPELRLLIAMLAGEFLNGDKLRASHYENLKTAFTLQYKNALAPYPGQLAKINQTFYDLIQSEESHEQDLGSDSDVGSGGEEAYPQTPVVIEAAPVPEEEFSDISVPVFTLPIPEPAPVQPISPAIPFSMVAKVAVGALAALTSGMAAYYSFRYFNPGIPGGPTPTTKPMFLLPSFSNRTVDVLSKPSPSTVLALPNHANPVAVESNSGQLCLVQSNSSQLTTISQANQVACVPSGNLTAGRINQQGNGNETYGQLMVVQGNSFSNVTAMVSDAARTAFYQNIGLIGALATSALFVFTSFYRASKTHAPALSASTSTANPNPVTTRGGPLVVTDSSSSSSSSSSTSASSPLPGTKREVTRIIPIVVVTDSSSSTSSSSSSSLTSASGSASTTLTSTPRALASSSSSSSTSASVSAMASASKVAKSPLHRATPPSKKGGIIHKRLSLVSEVVHHTPRPTAPAETVGSNSRRKSMQYLIAGASPLQPRTRSVATYASPNKFGTLALLGSEMPVQGSVARSPGALSTRSNDNSVAANSSVFSPGGVTVESTFTCGVEQLVGYLIAKSESVKNGDVNAFIKRMHVFKEERAKAQQILSFALDQYFDKCEFKSYMPETIEVQSERRNALLKDLEDCPHPDLVRELVILLNKYESDLNEGDTNKYWFLHYTNMLLSELSLIIGKEDFSVEEYIKGLLGVIYYNKTDEISTIIEFLKKSGVKDVQKAPTSEDLDTLQINLEYIIKPKLLKAIQAFKVVLEEAGPYTPTFIKDDMISRAEEHNKAYQSFMVTYRTYLNIKADYELAQAEKHHREKPVKKTDPYLTLSHADAEKIEGTLTEISEFIDLLKMSDEMNRLRSELSWENFVEGIVGSEEFAYLGNCDNIVSESFGQLKKAHKGNRERIAKEAEWVQHVSELKSELKLKDAPGLSLALKSYNLDELRSIVEVSGQKEELLKIVTGKIHTYFSVDGLSSEFNENILGIISQTYFESLYNNSSSLNGIALILPKVISNIKGAVESVIRRFRTPFSRYPAAPFKLAPSLEEILKPKSEVFSTSAACLEDILKEKTGAKMGLKEARLSEVDELFETVKGALSAIEKPAQIIHGAINLTTVNITGFREALGAAVAAIAQLKVKLEDAFDNYLKELTGSSQDLAENPFMIEYKALIDGFITHLNDCNKPGSYGNLYNITIELTAFKEKLKKTIQSAFDTRIIEIVKNPRKDNFEGQFRDACVEQKAHVDQFIRGYLAQVEQDKSAALKESAKEAPSGILTEFGKKRDEWTEFFQIENANVLMDCIADAIYLKATRQIADISVGASPHKRGAATPAKTPKPTQQRFDSQLLSSIHHSAKKRKANLDGFFE